MCDADCHKSYGLRPISFNEVCKCVAYILDDMIVFVWRSLIMESLLTD